MTTAMPRAIKLMPDYESWPLWHDDRQSGWDTNIDPGLLPVSDALKERRHDWSRRYDATLNRQDPAASGFASDREEAAFADQGRDLAEALKSELPSASWSYFDVRTGQTQTV